jgi:hypothetical protein
MNDNKNDRFNGVNMQILKTAYVFEVQIHGNSCLLQVGMNNHY